MTLYFIVTLRIYILGVDVSFGILCSCKMLSYM
jgi:hypothetical protein